MTVYVESNFVLEIALGQEQASAAEAILVRAERQEIALALPAFALSEPFSTVTQRSRTRERVVNQLKGQLRDLARSQSLQDDIRSIELTPDVLARIERHETDNLIATAERLLNVATMIPVDVAVFRQAMIYRTRYSLSPQDSLIYSTVVSHMTTHGATGPHYFVSKDRKDFRDPGIALELAVLECELLSSFPEAALLLEKPLPD